MKRISIILFFIITTIISNIYSQPILEAKANVDKNKVSLGDTIKYTVTAKLTGNVNQSPVIIPPDFDGFKIVGTYSQSSINIINMQSSLTYQRIYELLAIRSGENIIKPAKVKFFNPVTKKYEIIKTKPIKVYVKGGKRKYQKAITKNTPTPTPTPIVLKKEDIREIKLRLDFRFGEILPFIILAIVFIIILIIVAYFIFKKREKPLVEFKEDFDYKKESLKRLKQTEEILKRGEIKEFYYEVYEVIRFYLSNLIKESLEELTTREIVNKLEKKSLKKDKIEKINSFMKKCDMVKFADYKPDDNETEETLKQAEEIIKTI